MDRGYTAFYALMREKLPALRRDGAAMAVLEYVRAKTLGYGKHEDAISLSQFERGTIAGEDGRQIDEGTGHRRPSVIRGIRKPEALGLLRVHRRRMY